MSYIYLINGKEVYYSFKVGKNSKLIFIFNWSLFRDGTNHPSIALKVISCSIVNVEESVFSLNQIFYVLKT